MQVQQVNPFFAQCRFLISQQLLEVIFTLFDLQFVNPCYPLRLNSLSVLYRLLSTFGELVLLGRVLKL